MSLKQIAYWTAAAGLAVVLLHLYMTAREAAEMK